MVSKGKSHHEIARKVMDELGIVTMVGTHHMYWYDDELGKYRFDGEEMASHVIESGYKRDVSQHHVNEVMGSLERQSYRKKDNVFDMPPELISVGNGVLDLTEGELVDVEGKCGTKIALDIDWNPDREEEQAEVLEFIREIVPNATDSEKVLEGIGHCLYRDWVDHKSFMLIGGGANGKSTLLDIIETILGPGQVTNVPLQDFEHGFKPAELDGKLANICADISDEALKNTGMFKMLTGEDWVLAERKYENPFKFKNTAKMWFSANEIPYTKDTTHAFFRRWAMIDFPNTFEGEDKEDDIVERLTTEEVLEAWLVLAVDRFQNLYERGHFMEGGSNLDIKEKWERRANPYLAFVRDYVEWTGDDGDFISRDALKQEYAQQMDSAPSAKKLYDAVRSEHNPREGEKRNTGKGFYRVAWKDDVEEELRERQQERQATAGGLAEFD